MTSSNIASKHITVFKAVPGARFINGLEFRARTALNIDQLIVCDGVSSWTASRSPCSSCSTKFFMFHLCFNSFSQVEFNQFGE